MARVNTELRTYYNAVLSAAVCFIYDDGTVHSIAISNGACTTILQYGATVVQFLQQVFHIVMENNENKGSRAVVLFFKGLYSS